MEEMSVQFNVEPLVRFMAVEERTQRWVAKQAEVSEPTISRLLNHGAKPPEIQIAVRLARVVGCNPLDFYLTPGWPKRQ